LRITRINYFKARKNGYDDVLLIYGDENYISGLGDKNLFLLIKNHDGQIELITPTTDNEVVHPGVTRETIITLAEESKVLKVTKRRVTLKVMDYKNFSENF
jgi:branched-chain amino acid aminotransferase